MSTHFQPTAAAGRGGVGRIGDAEVTGQGSKSPPAGFAFRGLGGIPKLRDEVTGEWGGGMGVPYRELACVAASWAEDIK